MLVIIPFYEPMQGIGPCGFPCEEGRGVVNKHIARLKFQCLVFFEILFYRFSDQITCTNYDFVKDISSSSIFELFYGFINEA